MLTEAAGSIHWDGRPIRFAEGSLRPASGDGSFENAVRSAAVPAESAEADNVATIRQLAMQLLSATQTQMVQALTGQGESGPSTHYQWLGLLALASRMREDRKIEEKVVPAYRPGTDYDEIIGFAARRFGVPERVIHAVVKAESSYNPRAVSPAGARGLMQLMPGTASALGVLDSFDPLQNVMGGARYIRQMLDRFGGDLRKALAAYNWGPGNVEAKGMDRMPEETRNYVAYIARLLGDIGEDAGERRA